MTAFSVGLQAAWLLGLRAVDCMFIQYYSAAIAAPPCSQLCRLPLGPASGLLRVLRGGWYALSSTGFHRVTPSEYGGGVIPTTVEAKPARIAGLAGAHAGARLTLVFGRAGRAAGIQIGQAAGSAA
jgi:hypothetical protein